MSKATSTAIAAKVEQPVVNADASSIMAVISRAASDPNTDVDKLERLTALYERITARTSEQEFNAAMTEAQKEMRPVAADASNPQTRSKYASYMALDKALRPIYTKHGFALSFNTAPGPENYVRIVCDVSHNGGHSRQYQIDMPADGKGAKGGDVMTKTHAVGSGATYGVRYLLKMIFNIVVGDDDDGNTAAGGSTKISDQQLQGIIALCDEVDADKRKFCQFMRVDSLADITVRELPRATAALLAKKAHGAK